MGNLQKWVGKNERNQKEFDSAGGKNLAKLEKRFAKLDKHSQKMKKQVDPCQMERNTMRLVDQTLKAYDQTSHIEAGPLPFADALPEPKGEDTPMIHSHGALACIENIAKSLRPKGFSMLSDYGALAPRIPSEQVTFRNIGASAALAVNFRQIGTWFAQKRVSYLKPEPDAGHLVTHVLYNGPEADLFGLVDLLFADVGGGRARDAARQCF